ncbi:MAG: hypothetical protein ACFB4I_20980 [Cyanophyceae cyanobacterium]
MRITNGGFDEHYREMESARSLSGMDILETLLGSAARIVTLGVKVLLSPLLERFEK